MKNFTRILITTSLVLMVSLDAYSQDIFNSAKVGIGTVSPQQKLDVNGSIRFSGALMPGGLPGSTGNILLSNGVGNAPTWLPNGTSGTILVANSAGVPTWSSANSALLTTSSVVNAGANSAVVVTNGIGQVVGSGNVILDVQGNLNGILYGQGTGNSALFTSAGTLGQVLEANSAGVPTWTTPSLTAGWALAGNSIAATNFLGTTDAEPLVFEVNGKQAGRIDLNYNGSSGSNTYFGSWGILGSTTYGSPGGPTGDGATINVGIGISALGGASANGGNVAIGAFAYPAAIGGNYNVAVGTYSQLYAAYTGSGVQGYNVTIGAYSLYSNSLGYGEVAIGHQSMYGSGSPTAYGYYNTALGYYSLYNVGSGGSNVALGSNALISTTAGRNTAAGDSALYSNITGEYNTGLGYQSNVGAGNLTNATAIGYQAVAPANNSITLGNTAVTSLYLPGYTSVGSLFYTAANSGQVAALAPGAAGTILASNGTSSVPSWVSVAGINSVSGTPPIYITNPSSPTTPNIGIQGLPNNSDAGGVLYSLGSGTSALFTPSPSNSGLVLFSNGAGAPTWGSATQASAWNLAGNSVATTNFLGTTNDVGIIFRVNGTYAGSIDAPLGAFGGEYDVYLGYGASGASNSGAGNTGDEGGGGATFSNVGVGLGVLGNMASTTTVRATVAIGAYAMYDISGVSGSTAATTSNINDDAVGAYSLFNNTANDNVGVGSYALYSNTSGISETALGYQSMYGNGTAGALGVSNTAVGAYSLYSITTGGSNTAVGSQALFTNIGGKNTALGDSALVSNASGEDNTAAGYQALANTLGSNGNVSGYYNTALGYYANVASGALSNATAIGAYAYVGESNALVLGAINGQNSYTGTNTNVGIGTSTPAQTLEIGATSNTIRVDGLATSGNYNQQISASPGNIVYTNNATGDLYSLPNGANGNVLTLNTSGVPSWASPNAALTTYSITGNTGTAVVISGGNLNSVVGSGNVTLDVQSTTPEQGGIFYGTGTGTAATFNTTGSSGQVLLSAGTGAPTWGSVSSALTTNSIVNGGGSSSVVIGNGANQVVGATNASVDVQGTLNGILYGQGTGNSAIFSSAGASGQVLTANASGVPTWTTLSAPNAWSLTGNTTAPTYGTNFIGFTSSVPVANSEIEFVSNGQYAGVIDMSRSNIEFGRGAGGDSTAASYSAKAVTELEAIGAGAAESVTSGNLAMVAIGYDALHNYTIGVGEGNSLSNNAVGALALYNLTTGIPNNALGSSAGFNITVGSYNVSVGFASNYNQTTGSYNVAAGDSALYGGGGTGGTPATYIASYNTAVGVGSLAGIGTGTNGGTGGYYNTAIGVDAAEHTSTGNGNVAVGFQAGNANITGYYNTVMGYQANVSSNNLTNATAIGYQAIAPGSNSVTLGNFSVTSLYLPGYSAVGDLLYTSTGTGLVTGLTPGLAGTVLSSNGTSSAPTWSSVTGVNNVSGIAPIYVTGTATAPVVNIQGLPNNSDMGGVLYSLGSGNSALFTPSGVLGEVLQSNGTAAPTWVTPSAGNVWSLTGNTGTIPGTNYLGTLDDNSLEFEVNGHNAGSLDPLNTGYSAANVYLGSYGVLGSTTYGGAGNNDAGNGNVGIGLSALGSVGGPQYVGGNTGTTTGYNASQVAVGAFALASDIYGESNTALGSYSQFNENWASEGFGFNTSAGAYSLFSNSTGQYNTAIGIYSMYGSGTPTAGGSYNTAEGYNSLYTAGVGASNTALGSNSLYNNTGSRNTAVGDSTLYSNTSGTNNTALGYQANVTGNPTNATVIGYGATQSVSNSITLGNSAVTGLYLPGYTSTGSILYTSAASGLVSALTPGNVGYVLESQGTSSVPTWVSIAGANSLSGTAPVYITGPATSPDVNVQGLPNNSDMGGVLYSTGSGNAAVFTPTPTNAGLVLTSSAAGAAPTWQSAAASANSWNLSGNAGTTASNFLGTTSNEPLIFKVNGGYAGDLDYTDNATILGYGAASAGNTQYANGTASWPGAGCTIIGFEALYNLGGTTGPGATYVGAYALYNLTTAPGTSYDVAVGYATHFYPGPDNVANTSVGSFSLYSDAGSTATGSQEVALGYQSMFGTGTSSGIFGNSNVAIGYNSYFNPTGGQGGGNTAVGSWALYSGAGGGGKNTAVGDSSLYSNSTGEYNTGLGYQANVSAGNLTNATAIGYQAVAGESNSLVLGNGAAFVGINTSIPAQLLEVGGTANTIRVDGLKTGGTYNSTISASPGNIVYSNNANGDLYSLPNGTTGTVLTLNGSGVPTWSTIGSSAFTTYSITGNAGTSVVVAGGNLNSVVGSGNVTLDVQGTAGGVFYGTGASPAAFTSAGTTGQVLSSNGAGAPAWATLSVPNAWSINGNAGTTPGTNFIGTSSGSNEDLMFKVNGVVAGSLDAAGNNNAYYGYGVGVNGSTPGNGGSGDWGNQNVGMGTEAMGNIPANNSSVTGSEAIGAYAMYNSTAAFYNSAIGAYSQFNNAADYNVSVGAYTLYNNSAGLGEVALGHMSMYGSGTPAAMGNYNTAIGYYSLYSITTGGSNTAVGSNALFTSTGGRNSAVGDSALYLNTTGEYNTAVGYQAGYTNTTGAYNTLLGYNAGLSSNNLSNATVIGYNASAIAGNSITLGNTAATALYLPGYSSVGALLYTSAPSGLVSALTPGGAGTILASNGSGSVPTWISIAGINSVSGTSPIYVNSSTPSAPIVSIQGLSNNSDAGGVLYSLGSGTSALFTPTPSASGLVLTSSASGGAPTWQSPAAASSAWLLTGNAGTTPGTDFVGTTNAENLMFKVDGVVAGSLDEGSNSNAYYGYGVGVNGAVAGNGGSGDYGADNVGVGTEAMGNIPQNATSVTQTEAIGAYAMYNATAAYYNIAMGAYSQYNNGADFNASVGAYSLYSNNAGANEVALGYGSMYGTGTKETMGSNNTAIGYYSLYNSSTGGSNTAVGSNSLYNSSGGRNAAVGDSALVANTTGEWNTAIGYQSGITNTTGIENTLIGYQANVSANNLTNATAVGYNASAPSSNSVTLGNTSVTALYLPGYSSVGDLLYTSTGSGLVSALTPGAAGTVLSSNGTGNAPTWTNVAGVNSVTGTAPIYITNAGPNPTVNIQGLPNNSDMGGVLYSTGSASSAVFTATPAAGGLILTSAAAGGTPTWQSPSSVSGSWTLSGNGNATATSILGTTNAEPLVFEANSYPAGRIDFGTNDNAYYGYGAGTSTGDVGVSGGADVGVGLFALGNATTPTSSEAIGAYALYNAANVYDDVAFGAYSQFNNASYANVSVGSYSLYSDGGPGSSNSSTSGEGEVALGHYSMYGTGSKETMGNYNTAIGYYSLYSGTSTLNGGSNTAVGSNAMFNTTGGKNTAVGDSALASNTSGEYNTAVGYQALTTALASGANYNTALGYLANVSSTTASNATAVGANALASANNTLILGAINGVNSATISAAGNPGITNVGIGTNTPDADAALAIKTGHLETQVSVTGATSGITDPASGNLTPSAITITGTDVGGNLNWVEGSTTTPTSGAQVQISFINAYTTGSTPTVILTPANLATAQIMGTLQPYVSASSNTGFTLSFAAGSPVSGTTYSFNYFVIETQ